MKCLLSTLDSLANKKKLLIVFGVVIVLTLFLLYLENTYNLSYRAKLPSSFIFNRHEQPGGNSQPEASSNQQQDPEYSKQSYDSYNEKKVENDNKNNENLTKCWQVEPFVVVEKCNKCDPILRNSLWACKKTGYREVIQCEKYGQVSRSCPVPSNIVIRNYWTFEILSIVFTLVFSSFVIKRKRYLDHQATERVRQQLLSG